MWDILLIIILFIAVVFLAGYLLPKLGIPT